MSQHENTSQGNSPAHSLETEHAVLSCLLNNCDCWIKLSGHIEENDFYHYGHRLIFRALKNLIEDNFCPDIADLTEWLDYNVGIDNVGGTEYLSTLLDCSPNIKHLRHYTSVLREKSILRDLMQLSHNLDKSTAAAPTRFTSSEIIADIKNKISIVEQRSQRSTHHFADIKELLAASVERIDFLYSKDRPTTGVLTGYQFFDELTAGLQKSDLIIIAGRPSLGKTAFASNIALNASVNNNIPVAFFSMQTPSEQLMTRMISTLGSIDLTKIRTGKLADNDWPKLTSAVGLLSDSPIYIDDTPLCHEDIVIRAKSLARESGIGIILIDNLSEMIATGQADYSQALMSLKKLAKELNVPVVILTGVSRRVERRPNKRPMLSDIIGDIEEIADLVVSIYRDEVYTLDSPDKGTAEIIIGKNRNGPLGTNRLQFIGRYARFEE